MEVVIRSALFKYYIHDGIRECRLEFIGKLEERDLIEIGACLRTLEGSLNGRPLVLDLRRLDSADSTVSCWLTTMRTEGASCLTNSRVSNVKKARPQNELDVLSRRFINTTLSVLARLVGFLRTLV